MRKPWIITALAVIVLVSAVLLFALFDTKFRRFKRQSAKYHAEVAAACDFMLSHYLIGGTNGVEISVKDPALPPAIRNLNPLKIKVAHNWAWISVDDSHLDGLSITWEPHDESHTNVWNLVIGNGEGPSAVVYAANR